MLPYLNCFTKLIPNLTRVGVDGFLPVDFIAGVDIVKVREQFPNDKKKYSFWLE
jgi:hypothetical protein